MVFWNFPSQPKLPGCNLTSYDACDPESPVYKILSQTVGNKGVGAGAFLALASQLPFIFIFAYAKFNRHVAKIRGKRESIILGTFALLAATYILQSATVLNDNFIAWAVDDCRIWGAVLVAYVVILYYVLLQYTKKFYVLYAKQSALSLGVTTSLSFTQETHENGKPLNSGLATASAGSMSMKRGSLLDFKPIKKKSGIFYRIFRKLEKKLGKLIQEEKFSIHVLSYSGVMMCTCFLTIFAADIFQNDWETTFGTYICLQHPGNAILLLILGCFLSVEQVASLILTVAATTAGKISGGKDLCGVRTSLKRMELSGLFLMAVVFLLVPLMAAGVLPVDVLYVLMALSAEHMFLETIVFPIFTSYSLFYGHSCLSSSDTEIQNNWRDLTKLKPTELLEDFVKKNPDHVTALHDYLKLEMNLESLTFLLEVFDFQQRFCDAHKQIEENTDGGDTTTVEDGTTAEDSEEAKAKRKTGFPEVVKAASKASLQVFGTDSGSSRNLHSEDGKSHKESVREMSRSLKSMMQRSRSKLELGKERENQEKSLKEMKTEAERIAQLFLRPDSEFQINVPSHVFKPFQKQQGSSKGNSVYPDTASFCQDSHCFDVAKEEILFLLVQDIVPRFLKASIKHRKMWQRHIDITNEEVVHQHR